MKLIPKLDWAALYKTVITVFAILKIVGRRAELSSGDQKGNARGRSFSEEFAPNFDGNPHH